MLGVPKTPLTVFLLILAAATMACGLLPQATPPPLVLTPAPPAAFETLAALRAARVPERDLAALAVRLRGVDEVPRTVDLGGFAVGDTASFWYADHDDDTNKQIEAGLAYSSDQLNLWFEAGVEIDAERLRTAAAILETEIIPTNRSFFGEEWRPGVDGDNRLNVLHLESIGGNVAGYFSAADEFVTAVNPYSNQREMFYIGLNHAPLDSTAYYEVIAHEMQHMIHWHTDSNEATWLDEGMSVLAATLNGYEEVGFAEAFAALPDVQLNNFEYEGETTGAHYGAAYLFSAYFLDRFGRSATQSLLEHEGNGIEGVEATLADQGETITFDQLYADWAAAVYLDSIGQGQGIYNFETLDVPEIEAAASFSRFPLAEQRAIVNQYGADYIALEHNAPLTLVFTGTRQVQLVDTQAHSGDMMWTTVPGDDSDMTLTGRFDLSGLEKATLSFWSWYHIEEGWDYAYIGVSPDDGESWQLLATEQTTLDDPQGNSYGPGLTGLSDGEDGPRWVQQTADLTPFAGSPILLRFEYITDDALHRPGLALDDIAIPELAYNDDAEDGDGVWEAAGFVRHSNVLPQTFLLQLILLSESGARVQPFSLNENQQGRWTLPLDSEYDRAILVISGNTPVTTLPAAYAYAIDR